MTSFRSVVDILWNVGTIRERTSLWSLRGAQSR